MPGIVRFSEKTRPSDNLKDLMRAYTRLMKRLVNQIELCYPYAKEAGTQDKFIRPLIEKLKMFQNLFLIAIHIN